MKHAQKIYFYNELINYIYTDIINEFEINSIYIDSQLHFTVNEPLINTIKSLLLFL